MAYTGTLTGQDIAEVAAIRGRWVATALSTERVDRPLAEATIRLAYRTAGLDPPDTVVWTDSPLGGASAAQQLSSTVSVAPTLRDELWEHLDNQLESALGHQPWRALEGQLWRQLGPLRGQVRDRYWRQLRHTLQPQVEPDQLQDELDVWGDSHWLALYTHALRVAGLPPSPRLDALSAAVASNAWWWPMRGAVVVTDRPTVLACDRGGRLHNADGAALAWAEGFELWSWHGMSVPQSLIVSGWVQRIADARD